MERYLKMSLLVLLFFHTRVQNTVVLIKDIHLSICSVFELYFFCNVVLFLLYYIFRCWEGLIA